MSSTACSCIWADAFDLERRVIVVVDPTCLRHGADLTAT
jgi:hypothetical protein